MKTQYYTASSLDGFIATEDDSLRQGPPALERLKQGADQLARRHGRISTPWNSLTLP
jgi:hypothetical protein